MFRVWNPRFKSWSVFSQDHLARVLLDWGPDAAGHDAVMDAVKSVRLFNLYSQLQASPQEWQAAQARPCAWWHSLLVGGGATTGALARSLDEIRVQGCMCPRAMLVDFLSNCACNQFCTCNVPCHSCDMLLLVYRKRCWRLSRQSRSQSETLHSRAYAWATGRRASAERPSWASSGQRAIKEAQRHVPVQRAVFIGFLLGWHQGISPGCLEQSLGVGGSAGGTKKCTCFGA